MKARNPKFILFNVAAVVIAAAALVAVVRSIIAPPRVEPCSGRYLTSTAFALERGGALLTAADLQAGLGGKDAGVIENLAVARLQRGPVPVAISVALPKGSASPHTRAGVKGGLSFPWEPRSLQGKTAACLSYRVLFPDDFDFHRGGVLPGLFGGADGTTGQEGFAARVTWSHGGEGAVAVRVSAAGSLRVQPLERGSFAFQRGRWIMVEQEIVLNTPGQANGVLRLWLDGAPVLDRTDIAYRGEPAVTISGVAVDAFYGGDDVLAAAPTDAKLWLSPFEVRWN
jgi:hypothetical protein